MHTRLIAALVASVVATLLLPALAVAADDGGDPLIVVTGKARVPAAESVDGLFVVDADTLIDGTVTGDAIVIAGRTTVTGTVEGDLTVLTGPSRLLPGAEVTGDLVYGDEEPQVSERATVGGEVRNENWDEVTDALPVIGGAAIWIAVTLSGLVLGVLLVAFAPRAVDATFRVADQETGLVVGMGIGTFIALPVVGVGAALSLVGLPLAIAVFLALLPLAAIAYVNTAWILGRAILPGDRDRFICFLAGFALLRVAAIVPLLGLIAWLLAVVFGLGALVLAAHRTRSGPEDYTTAPPPPAAAG